MKLARYVFGIAAVWGILVLTPMYFLLEKTGIDDPPVITHSEYYYGFVGVALAFQFVFVIVASDPIRFRPLMIASVVEKLMWCVPVLLLYFGGRVATTLVIAACMDLTLGVLFSASYLMTGNLQTGRRLTPSRSLINE
jgi:hypothetical protein